jgi:cytosine/adenosine deaminase-related metal-dependent hydrolase
MLKGALLFRLDGSAATRGDLWLDGTWITAVCPPDPPPADAAVHDRWDRVNVSDSWIIPGFVATHVHLCQTPLRGTAERLDLYRWLSRVIWPMEAAHDPQTIDVAAEAGIRQLFAGGVTTVLDMGTTRHTGSILAAAARLGIRGYFGPSLMDRGPDTAGPLLRPVEESLAEINELAAHWEGHDGGRIRLALCPRFVPSVSDAGWKHLVADHDVRSFPVHSHASETREEVAEVRGLTGQTPPAYLASLAGVEGRLKLAHCIWIDAGDRAALRRVGAAALHCPGSNAKLGSGICDTLAIEEAGIPVSLGPDGAACNNRLDPWHEMRLAAGARSLLHGPQSVDPRAILRMATRGGAESLGLGAQAGSLEAGKRADLVLLDPSLDPAMWDAGGGAESPEAALVFAGSPALVSKTLVGGRTVYDRTGSWPERNEFLERLRHTRRLLAERAGLPLTLLTSAGPSAGPPMSGSTVAP